MKPEIGDDADVLVMLALHFKHEVFGQLDVQRPCVCIVQITKKIHTMFVENDFDGSDAYTFPFFFGPPCSSSSREHLNTKH